MKANIKIPEHLRFDKRKKISKAKANKKNAWNSEKLFFHKITEHFQKVTAEKREIKRERLKRKKAKNYYSRSFLQEFGWIPGSRKNKYNI